MATTLKEVLDLIKAEQAEQVERIDADRYLSADGRALRKAEVKRTAAERAGAATAAELGRLRSATAAERERYDVARRRYSDGLDVPRQQLALSRAQNIVEGGDWSAVKSAIDTAVRDGDRYAVEAFGTLMPKITKQFVSASNGKQHMSVIEAQAALGQAAQALEPVDVAQARQWVTQAEQAEAEALEAASMLRFEGEWSGDRGLVMAIDGAVDGAPAGPVTTASGGLETAPGRSWMMR